MSYKDCLLRGITDETDAKLKAKLNEKAKLYSDTLEVLKSDGHLNGKALEDEAARIVQDGQQRDLLEMRKRHLYQAKTLRDLYDHMQQFRLGDNGKIDYGEAVIGLLQRDGRSRFSGKDFMTQKKALRGQAFALASDVTNRYKPRKAGIVKPNSKNSDMDDLVRGIYNPNSVDDTMRAIIEGAKEAMEYLRLQANSAGATIGKLDKYFPQNHDRLRILSYGKENWIKFIDSKLDWSSMRNRETGELIPKSERSKTLEEVWENIASDGINKFDPTEMGGSGSLSKRVGQSRFLIFKDADSQLSYHKEFGNGTVFDSYVNHIDNLSTNVALMQIFGPDVSRGKEFVEKVGRKFASQQDIDNAGEAKRLFAGVFNGKVDTFDTMFKLNTGQLSPGEDNKLAKFGSDVSNILTANMLGGTIAIAAPTDMLTSQLTKQFNGMGSSGTLKTYMKLLASSENQMIAIRSGLINENAISMSYGGQRLLGEATQGSYLTERITDTTLRLTGLSHHTDVARWAFGMEMMGAVADSKNVGWEKLDEAFRKMFERYGLDKKDWQEIQATKSFDWKGTPILRMNEMANEQLRQKYLAMIHGEIEYAVPNSANARARTVLRGATKPGTVPGELLRSTSMFKNFPVAFQLMHVNRGLSQANPKDRMGYLSHLVIGSTAMGALAVQMKELAKGREPIPMDSWAFWGKAFLAGGGMGIYGDFLFSNTGRYGQGLGETLAGPLVSLADDALGLTVGNLVQAVKGEDTNFGAELSRFAQRVQPGRNIIYAERAQSALLWDHITRILDDKADQRFKRKMKNSSEEFGNDYWWNEGDASPF